MKNTKLFCVRFIPSVRKLNIEDIQTKGVKGFINLSGKRIGNLLGHFLVAAARDSEWPFGSTQK